MRRLFDLSMIALITITLSACSDSSTGPDPDSGEDGGGNSEPTTYSLSVDMTPSDAGSISELEDSYEEGEDVEVQADPNDEYVFVGWSGDVESEENPLSLTVDQNYDLTANFELKDYELTINTDGEGSVSEDVVEEKTKEYEHGTVVELTANPAEGYKFVEWTGDVEGSDNPAQITVDDPKEVTAVFEKKSYPLTINTDGDGAVREEVLQQKTTDYEFGAVVELTANSGEGSEFAGWSGDVTGTDNPVEVTVEDTMEVTAIFESETFTVSTSTTGEGTLERDPDQDEYDYDSIVEITADPDEGWEFSEWGGDASGTDNPLTVTVTEDLDIAATFEEEPTYSLTTNTSGNGSITKDPDEEEYPEGTEVELTADPDEGWVFVEWQGDLAGTQNPIQVTVDSDKEVTAVFEEEEKSDFYLHENGVTIMCPDALLRETGEVNGVEYEAVDRSMINLRILNSLDLTTVCTSLITDMSELFDGNSALDQDLSNWDVSNVTDMHAMFRGALSFYADLNHWDVSNVMDMSSMFDDAKAFIGEISNWDVSSVTNMSKMFSSASNFNGDISNWNVSSVTNMSEMFYLATSFNGDLNNWDVSNVTTMDRMFNSAESFNKDLNSWNVSNVVDMERMFMQARNFNGNISSWNVSNVTNMRRMFNNTDNTFNQDISNWDVGNVTDMYGMFYNAPSFNQNLNSWNVGNVTTMRHMFHHATNFNGDISSWDVSSVTDMEGMFAYAVSFNGNLSSWDVNSVTDMSSMFINTEIFNSDIGNWNVGNVTNMEDMFRSAKNFNQYIGDWDVSSIPDRFAMESMFYNAESFYQDLSGWCVTNISRKPTSFDGDSGFEDEDALQPDWGTCPD
ncbi:MAG: BspA family leucine-rich repeat surface protein [Balneolaceae bacterium]